MRECRLDRVHALGDGGGAGVVLVRLDHISRGREVVGERACVLVEAAGKRCLDRLADQAMQLRAAGTGEPLVDGLSDQGVREAVAPDGFDRLVDDLGSDGRFEAFSDLLCGHARDQLEDIERELASADRGERQQALACLVEPA